MAKYAAIGGCAILAVIIIVLIFTNRFVQYRIQRRIFKIKNGNITREENKLINIYVNFHYPVNVNYKGYCIECQNYIGSDDNVRCPVCGCYICNVCGTCHPRCLDRDAEIVAAENYVTRIVNGEKSSNNKKIIKSISYRIAEQKKLPAGKKYNCKGVKNEENLNP